MTDSLLSRLEAAVPVLTLDSNDHADMAIETLVITTPAGRSKSGSAFPQSKVLTLCRRGPQSLAEIAAKTSLPFGATRAMVARMITAGLVSLAGPPAPDDHDPRRTDIARRILGRLHAL